MEIPARDLHLKVFCEIRWVFIISSHPATYYHKSDLRLTNPLKLMNILIFPSQGERKSLGVKRVSIPRSGKPSRWDCVCVWYPENRWVIFQLRPIVHPHSLSHIQCITLCYCPHSTMDNLPVLWALTCTQKLTIHGCTIHMLNHAIIVCWKSLSPTSCKCLKALNANAFVESS